MDGGSGGSQLLVAFDAAGASSEGGPTIEFTATELSLSSIAQENVLAAWGFETDLLSGTDVQLSMQVGSGLDSSLFNAWHSEDGDHWTLLDAEILYDGEYASFIVDGFSSYAITIPEPSTALLVMLAGGAWTLRRRGRNGHE